MRHAPARAPSPSPACPPALQDNEPLMRALSNLINLNQPDLVLFVGEALVGNDAGAAQWVCGRADPAARLPAASSGPG